MPKRKSQMMSFEGASMGLRETIRRSCSSPDYEEIIPISIQNFFWQQSNPFIKHKYGHLTDASATIFHQLLVQNNLHSLPPSLTNAIATIPRWLLIKAAFPHVMHACSSIIKHNLHSNQQTSTSFPPTITQLQSPMNSNQSLTQTEIRLFHTLHSLIFYFNDHHDKILSLNTIQLFIYLFIPYIHTYFRQNEQEFLVHSDLYQGMKLIWQSLFECHLPNLRIFNTFVKPIFFSNGQKVFEDNLPRTILKQSTTIDLNKELKSSTFLQSDSDPTTHDSASDADSSSLTNNNHLKFHAPLVQMNSICSISDLSRLTITPQSPSDKFNPVPGISASQSTPSMTCLPSVVRSTQKPHSSEYLLLATYLDISIIRTLFSSSWLTDGYIWCLEYLYKRLTDISDELLSETNLSTNSFKSFSISQFQNINYSKQFRNTIVEKQYLMTMGRKQSVNLLNMSKECPSRKNSDVFLIKKIGRNTIQYIDEDRIEHLDLANDHLSDPTLVLFRPSILPNLSSMKTNLLSMKTYSHSDQEINYKHLESLSEVVGSTSYINSNGTINFSVILAGIHAVICKESHIKICELVMNIVDVLFGLNLVSSKNELIENEIFQLIVDIILRILKRLGCPNCQPRAQSFLTDQLRGKVRVSLNKLRLRHEKLFEKYFLNFVNNAELSHIFDILHALCGYCMESTSGLAHYSPYINIKPDSNLRQTYSNNFENTHLHIDGFLLKLLFQPLITRLSCLEDYLLSTENLLLYNESRVFLLFIKENHGGIFRSAVFSSLINSERKLQRNKSENLFIDLSLVQIGLLRLNFLFQSCPPGTLPDPHFLNNILFLNAPLISKAGFLLECAYFVRKCSIGQWPDWMRMNLNSFRPHEPVIGRQNENVNAKNNKIYQAAAARMFYIWGEALSSQLEASFELSPIHDEIYEDYYNEAIVNPTGHECPYSLQLVVCLLLYEITRFLRETYETLPKLSSFPSAYLNSRPQRTNIPDPKSDHLRMDSVVSQTSNRSTNSLTSEQPLVSPNALTWTTINMNPLLNERHISFAKTKENDSNGSNHTAIVMNEDVESEVVTAGSNLISTPMKSKLMRKTSGKLRKPSVRIKDKNSQHSSFRNRRRSHVSNLSTDTDGHQSNFGSANQDVSDEHRIDDFDSINSRPFPWIKIVIRIYNQLHSNIEKYLKSSKNLFQALKHMYQQSSSHSRSSSMSTKQERLSSCLANDDIFEIQQENNIDKHFKQILTYLDKQVKSFVQLPLMILCKSSVVLEDEHYSQILRLSWELLLDLNEELASCAATIVILAAARAGHLIDQLFQSEMENPSGLIRYYSILKFEILWRFRFQFWIRLEDSAHSMMKILPPSIEFVLPSPALGIANLQIVDPPWMPHAKTLVQQAALNQEEVRAVVTTSKTRKKHQQELLHTALMTEEISKQVARENFSMSTVSMLSGASFEPLLHQIRDDEEEIHESDERCLETNIQIRQAQSTFPSAFSSAIFHLVDMLEDEEIMENGAIVSGEARKALWTCLIDEPTLLIRFFFEKLSQKDRRNKSLQSLRRLMIYLTDIPSQFSHAIFNYVLGLLLSMVRSPLENSQELILVGLTLLWQIIPYLHGLVLKDFKQILRKEQAEMMILITGNIPSTKKVIIHGPDLSQIPTQALISEDTQFSHVLQEALEFFGITDSKRNNYYLIDIKSQQIHISDAYVRDFYFFRRNIYPQLGLVYLDNKKSQRQLEQIAIYIKTMELSKVLFARYLIENTPFNQTHNCITFFHEELLKSPLFPRKPLESDFNLYTKISEKELWNLDMLHKYNWIKLISSIFFNMDGKTTTTWDITLFLPVINGAFILHCEDLVMLRFCLATYINIVKHFRHIFATNGYLLIMPTFLRVYSNIQSNPMLKKSIEFCCRQFFILHRIPFILQMLGSISQLLDVDEQAEITDTNKIQPIALFRLLIALEQTNIDAMRDDYSILELIKHDSMTTKVINTPIVAALGQGTMMTPSAIKSLDFCYTDDETIFTLLNCFDVCVTVVAYSPDSVRSLQMLGIIDILIPKYFEYLKDKTKKPDIQKFGREEMKTIGKLSIVIKTMINICETLTRTFVEPKSETTTSGGNYKHSRGSYRTPSIAPDEDSMNRFLDDRTKSRAQDADERKQASEFRWPRDTLLSIVSTYNYLSIQRFKEISKLLNEPIIPFPEFLDPKSHIRLADIAHTLLKLSSFDTLTISSRGLQSYFQKLLPFTNWSHEQLRPALNLLLRRIDRMFVKICKKPMIKRCFDWEATAGILNGIYLTIDRHPYIAFFPNIKTLISGCISLILNENVVESNHSVPRLDTPTFPKEFSRVVIKLVGRYLLAIKYQPNLEVLTSSSWSANNLTSSINHLLHFLLPLMFWTGSGRKDVPKFHSLDISYIITVLLSSIKPQTKLATTMGGTQSAPTTNPGKQFLTIGENILASNNFTHKSMRQLKDLLQTASLLGLKILILAFHKQLKREWTRLTQAIKSICQKQSNISTNLLLFIDFLVSYKTPIYLILRPFLVQYMHSVTSQTDYDMIASIQQKLSFEKILPAKSIREILDGLIQELNQLKAELTDESKPMATTYDSRFLSVDKVRFDHRQAKHPDPLTTDSNRTTNNPRIRRQEQVNEDTNPNFSLKKRTEKIRANDAFAILEPYYARYRLRCGGVSEKSKQPLKCLTSISDQASNNEYDVQSPTLSPRYSSLLRSEASISDRNLSTTNDRSFQFENSMIEQIQPKFRTFRGWKRNTAYIDRSRLNKNSLLTHISSEPNVTLDLSSNKTE